MYCLHLCNKTVNQAINQQEAERMFWLKMYAAHSSFLELLPDRIAS
jgi:hypothetical protein